MDGVLEIITGRERRRRWSTDEKLRFVAALEEAGARVTDIAARYDVCESLVFTWRRQARESVLATLDAPVFMPMQMIDAQRDRRIALRCPLVRPLPLFANIAFPSRDD